MNGPTLDATTELQTQLCTLLSEVSQDKVCVATSQVTAPLKDLGLDSVVLLSFLVAIEDLLGFEWPTDVPKETFASIASIAHYVETVSA